MEQCPFKTLWYSYLSLSWSPHFSQSRRFPPVLCVLLEKNTFLKKFSYTSKRVFDYTSTLSHVRGVIQSESPARAVLRCRGWGGGVDSACKFPLAISPTSKLLFVFLFCFLLLFQSCFGISWEGWTSVISLLFVAVCPGEYCRFFPNHNKGSGVGLLFHWFHSLHWRLLSITSGPQGWASSWGPSCMVLYSATTAKVILLLDECLTLRWKGKTERNSLDHHNAVAAFTFPVYF